MNKYDFVKELTACLTGKIDQMELDDTIRYYQDYIDMEMKKGRTEAEVVESLVSPRLLARTITDAKKNGSEQGSEYGYTDYTADSYERETKERAGIHFGQLKVPLWLLGILFVLILVLILCLLFSVLSFFAPAIMLIMIFLLIYRMFAGRR